MRLVQLFRAINFHDNIKLIKKKPNEFKNKCFFKGEGVVVKLSSN